MPSLIQTIKRIQKFVRGKLDLPFPWWFDQRNSYTAMNNGAPYKRLVSRSYGTVCAQAGHGLRCHHAFLLHDDAGS